MLGWKGGKGRRSRYKTRLGEIGVTGRGEETGHTLIPRSLQLLQPKRDLR